MVAVGRPRAIIASEVRRVVLAAAKSLDHQEWPDARWQADPIGFIRRILGDSPLPHQEAIIRSVLSSKRTTIRSGQKTGKTRTLVWLALWHYCCFPESKTVIMAAKESQIDTVIWSELTKVVSRAKRLHRLTIEQPAAKASGGLQSPDGRMIFGFTARHVDALGGISGPSLLFLVDEASSLSDAFAEGIEGNTAGGNSRILYISNPIRTSGPYYDSWHTKGDMWEKLAISSEEVALTCEATGLRMPGIADAGTIREWEERCGRDSPFFKQRVLGEFLLNENARICNLEDITSAQERWASGQGGQGTLSVGVDVAGHGADGDEWAFAVVRGNRCEVIYRFRGLTDEAALSQLRGILRQYRRGDETPGVVVDASGMGAAFYGRCRAEADTLRTSSPRDAYVAYGLRVGERAQRNPDLYGAVRDELWASCAEWLKTGAIPVDPKLEVELHAPVWAPNVRSVYKATGKDDLYKILGRSPDSADALCLAVWRPLVGTEKLVPGQREEVGEVVSDPFEGFDKPTRRDRYSLD